MRLSTDRAQETPLDVLGEANARMYGFIDSYLASSTLDPENTAVRNSTVAALYARGGISRDGLSLAIQTHENMEGSLYVSTGEDTMRFRWMGDHYMYLNGSGTYVNAWNGIRNLHIGRCDGNEDEACRKLTDLVTRAQNAMQDYAGEQLRDLQGTEFSIPSIDRAEAAELLIELSRTIDDAGHRYGRYTPDNKGWVNKTDGVTVNGIATREYFEQLKRILTRMQEVGITIGGSLLHDLTTHMTEWQEEVETTEYSSTPWEAFRDRAKRLIAKVIPMKTGKQFFDQARGQVTASLAEIQKITGEMSHADKTEINDPYLNKLITLAR